MTDEGSESKEKAEGFKLIASHPNRRYPLRSLFEHLPGRYHHPTRARAGSRSAPGSELFLALH